MKNKKNIIVIAAVILVIVVAGIFLFLNRNKKEEVKVNPDAKKFANEYETVSEDNPFVYKNVDEIIKIMKNGTGVVYLGYPECPWCMAYVKYLNEVANDVGIEKIYYCNTKKVKEESMDKYYELRDLLHGNLQYTDEGEEWIFVPNVSFHISGEIIGNDYETSKDTHGLRNPKEYWTKDEVKDLKEKLTKCMTRVKEASNICTDCNK